MRILEGKLAEELERIACERAPLEAVGLILPDDRIIELPNRADDPEHGFTAARNDIIEAIAPLHNMGLEDVILFHTHPQGGIGPSKIDMRNKTPFHYHLVISCVDGGVVFAWY